MSPLLYVMQQNIELLLPKAPSEAVRESLHVLYNAAKDVSLQAKAVLTAFAKVAAEPYREDLLTAAVSEIFPSGAPDALKTPVVVPTPPPAPVETPAEQPAEHHE